MCVCVRGTWAIGVFSDDFRSCRLVRNGYPGTRNPSGFRPNVFKRELPPVRRRRIIETTSNGPFRAAYPAHEIKPIRRTPPATRQTPFIVFIIIIAVTFPSPSPRRSITLRVFVIVSRRVYVRPFRRPYLPTTSVRPAAHAPPRHTIRAIAHTRARAQSRRSYRRVFFRRCCCRRC